MSETEVWIQVPDYPNTEVSNLGRFKSNFRGLGRLREPYLNANGYLIIGLQNGAYRKKRRAHSVVAEAFIGPRPKGMDVNHKDGDKQNNRADNLEYVSRSENLKHAWANGLAHYSPFKTKGEEKWQAKLKECDVLAIREGAANGESCCTLSDRYGVSYYTGWDIIKRRSWTHI